MNATRGEDSAAATMNVRWRISGRVQGVGFRWFVRQAALAHAARGDVRNLSDGTVEVRVMGAPRAIERLLAELRQGPPGARVDDVTATAWDGSDAGPGFEIRR